MSRVTKGPDTADHANSECFDSQPLLSIAIVSYNTCAMTSACLDAVIDSDLPFDYEVLVIDNNSPDDSAAMLQHRTDPNLHVWALSENVGFACGNNRVLSHAKGQYLLLLNPDTVVEPEAIRNLMNFAEKYPNAGIWGGITFFEDGSLNPTYCWADQSLWSLLCQALGLSSLFRNSRWLNPEGVGCWNKDKERSVDIVSGCFFLTTTVLWQRLDGFHEAFYMYGEEADLCARARALGYQPRITNSARLIHHGGASESSPSSKLVRLISAKIDLIRRHFGPIRRPLGVALLSVWPLSRLMAHRMMGALGRSQSVARAKVWKDVWEAREKWLSERVL